VLSPAFSASTSAAEAFTSFTDIYPYESVYFKKLLKFLLFSSLPNANNETNLQ